MDFCGGGVAAGSKVMVVWGELQAGGEALQVMCCLVVAGLVFGCCCCCC